VELSENSEEEKLKTGSYNGDFMMLIFTKRRRG
jgi:hypothetical protein